MSIKHHTFLFELGAEELPHAAQQTLRQVLPKRFAETLQQQQLSFGAIHCYTTPRRVTVIIDQLIAKQATRVDKKRGPALLAAFDDQQQPTPAALGFARSCGVAVEDLGRLETDKGHWLYFEKELTGQQTIDILPEIIQSVFHHLPLNKTMRWGEREESFIRPVHWLLTLFGHDIVPLNLLGLNADRLSFGHRIHAPGAISLNQAEDYLPLLETARVVVDPIKRQALIMQQIQTITEPLNARLVLDEPLLAEVTDLVEWPVALCCKFDSTFLKVPKEVLICAMQSHQKCFAMTDHTDALLPKFITISNIQSRDPNIVVQGNERIMTARLHDALFFYQTDQKQSLSERSTQLAHISFQAKLGNLLDKCQRIAQLSHAFINVLALDPKQLKQAAMLCKADLLTDMVYEFPELQGIMGQYYAKHDGLNDAIANSLREYYYPQQSGDPLPQEAIAIALGIADRLDSLVGIFGINKQPTGDKDPFALRRAAYGVLRLLIEKQLPLDLSILIDQAIQSYQVDLPNHELKSQLLNFFNERLKAWYRDQGLPTSVIQSVLAKSISNLSECDQRIRALNNFVAHHDLSALIAAHKRVHNILKKQTNPLPDLDPAQLIETAEKTLHSTLEHLIVRNQQHMQQGNWHAALNELLALKAPIDAFFESVMVMVDDETLRYNRLALLGQLAKQLSSVAELAKL